MSAKMVKMLKAIVVLGRLDGSDVSASLCNHRAVKVGSLSGAFKIESTF